MAMPQSTRGAESAVAAQSGREQFNIVVVGHVDHGKSTVIGRLLADTGSLPDGKLEQVRLECARNAKPFEYAFLLDALKAEQAQGITIDTARSFFKSGTRDYIIIDAPGHIEFLKNMVTGAARAEAAILVIDAKEGVRENSRRHGYMMSMLGIRQVVVCVNKMDLATYSESVFEGIREEYSAFLDQVGIVPKAFIPIAAFYGENLVEKSDKMPWYKGEALLALMDSFAKEADAEAKALRMPVQDVYKFTEEGDDRRIVAGRIESGRASIGDRVQFQPSGKHATIKSIEEFNAPTRDSVGPGVSIGFTLDPEIYVRPGEVMTKRSETPLKIGNRLRVNVFWMGRGAFVVGRRYKLKIASAEVPVWLEEIRSVLDASDLSTEKKQQVDQYEVGECILETFKPIAFDLNADSAATGRFVIVDHYEIAGGGIILEDLGTEQKILQRQLDNRERSWERSPIPTAERAGRYGQGSAFILVAGREPKVLSELCRLLEKALFQDGRFVYYLGLSNAALSLAAPGDEGEDRAEVLRRLGETAHLFADAGAVFITSVVDCDETERATLRALAVPADPITVAIGEHELASVDAEIDGGVPPAEIVAKIRRLLYEKNVLPEFVI